MLTVGLMIFAAGLYIASFGITYVCSGLTLLGALVSIVGLMGEGRISTSRPKINLVITERDSKVVG